MLARIFRDWRYSHFLRKTFLSYLAALLGAPIALGFVPGVVAGLQLRFPESDIRLFPRPIHPCRPRAFTAPYISRLFRTGLTQVPFDGHGREYRDHDKGQQPHRFRDQEGAQCLQAFQVTKPIVTPQLTPGRAIRRIRSIADSTTNCGAARACYAGATNKAAIGLPDNIGGWLRAPLSCQSCS